MKKVLVTGGAGFIGSNLVKAYINEGYKVVVVDNLSTSSIHNIPSDVTFYEEDIRSNNFAEIVLKEQPDIINHHAAQIDVQFSVKNPMEDASINILGTINVLESARQLKQLKDVTLVYASSAAVYGEPHYLGVDEKHPIQPLSPYGASKFSPEFYFDMYNKLHNIQYTVFRYANVYGIGQDPKGEGGVVSILVDCITSNSLFTIFGDGEQTRDFIFVDDIVAANLLASKNPVNTICNVSTNTQTSLIDLLKISEEVINNKIEMVFAEERSGDIKHSYLNNEKTIQLLNWKPSNTLKEGLDKTIQYYKTR
ncbi:NAD-dependent epimerase/dehydratase family protein [Gottfriedia sp. NPDC058432]|uniref:NAD-dependent epimerase/dehydratase family protein n=1 Tax=Gottfriedia sp. NPDC058432 TaxID=3346497 RepID=UPI00364ED07A